MGPSGPPQSPEAYVIADEAPWTFDEVDEIVSMYLANNKRPLDPNYPLLQDVLDSSFKCNV